PTGAEPPVATGTDPPLFAGVGVAVPPVPSAVAPAVIAFPPLPTIAPPAATAAPPPLLGVPVVEGRASSELEHAQSTPVSAMAATENGPFMLVRFCYRPEHSGTSTSK